MKTTYFQKFFDFCFSVFLTVILCTLCTVFLGFMVDFLQKFTYLSVVTSFISMIFWLSLTISIISSIIFILLVSYEIKKRQKEDNLSNLWESIKQTLAIRIFLHQSEHSEVLATTEQTKMKQYNPVNKHFNRAVRQSIVDVREDNVIFMIRLPKTQQAKKILNDMDTMIIEEMARYNPDYFFSPQKPAKKWTYLIGNKRE